FLGRKSWLTFAACRPFGPRVTSNSTRSPSASVLKPSPWIAEKCTNTSSPLSCERNPKPFDSLNHFTVPVATLRLPVRPERYVQNLLIGRRRVSFDLFDRPPAVVGLRQQKRRSS